MASSSSHLDPHTVISQSDSSSFVEVTPPSSSLSSTAAAQSDNSSNVYITPDASASGSSNNNGGDGDGARSGMNESRPQPGSTELPLLRTRLDSVGNLDDGVEDGESGPADKLLPGNDGEAYDKGYESETDFFKPRRRGAGSGASAGYTAEEEKEVVKKLDKRLVLFLALLYMLSFLDRSSK